MGTTVSRTEFFITESAEPHSSRRKAILKAHPEVRSLMVIDPYIKWQLLAYVIVDFAVAYLVRDLSWVYLVPITYVVGGTFNHILNISLHELSHNTAFGFTNLLKNRLLAMFAALPTAVPSSYGFKKYHLDHHKFMGDEALDPDLPTPLEARLARTSFGKFIWLMCLPLLYSIRPMVVNPKPVTPFEVFTYLVQITVNLIVIKYWGFRSFFYMLGGTYLGLSGLHPLAGHFISEHYTFVMGYETYSYYGSLNGITWNLGYHNEHHDFPNIPGRYLPKLHEIAKDYYENLPCHTSWIRVLKDFIFSPNMGPAFRIKRFDRSKRLQIDNPKETLCDTDDYAEAFTRMTERQFNTKPEKYETMILKMLQKESESLVGNTKNKDNNANEIKVE